jgi:hypothetical protein
MSAQNGKTGLTLAQLCEKRSVLFKLQADVCVDLLKTEAEIAERWAELEARERHRRLEPRLAAGDGES